MQAVSHDRPDVRQILPNSNVYPKAVSDAFGKKAPTLSVMGNLDLLGSPAIGFCGSRKASDKGLETAEDCADQAAREGFAVVSGNAAGVDLMAHMAALKAGGATILVLPEGMDHFRIRKVLRELWDWERVLVISQFEANAVWQAYRAMARNELIIALSRVMIVIEAGLKGGTMSAGLSTLKFGKPLFVANYHEIEKVAPGNAKLLNQGAQMLSKSKSTGRANIDRIAAAAEARIAPGSKSAQLHFL
jgi:DNA processing protein